MSRLYSEILVRALLVLWILTFSGRACDPVLESLIFSKSRVETIDLYFREFSTRLSEMGSQWRSKRHFESHSVVQMKAVWLQIYQDYYLKPPTYFSNSQFWKEQLDKIALNLKKLGLYVDKNLPEEAHQLILSIQSTLVDLYDHSREMTLFQRGKFLEYIIELVYKNRAESELRNDVSINEDYQRLVVRLAQDWELMHSQLSENLKFQWPLESWRLKLDSFLTQAKSKDGLNQVQEFMHGIYAESWKNIGRK